MAVRGDLRERGQQILILERSSSAPTDAGLVVVGPDAGAAAGIRLPPYDERVATRFHGELRVLCVAVVVRLNQHRRTPPHAWRVAIRPDVRTRAVALLPYRHRGAVARERDARNKRS